MASQSSTQREKRNQTRASQAQASAAAMSSPLAFLLVSSLLVLVAAWLGLSISLPR